MTPNPQYCIAYLIVDAFCMILTILARRSLHQDGGSETQVRFFKLLLYANMLFLIFDALWAVCVSSGWIPASSPIPSIVNGVSLLSVVACAYFWMCYSLAYFGSELAYSKTMQLIGAIPIALALATHIYGTAFNQNVIVVEDGSISYGVAHTAILVFAVLYLAAATAAAIRHYRHATHTEGRRTSLVFVSFMFAPALAAVFDSFVPNTPIAAPAIMLSIMFVIMSLKESRIFTDSLTGINNRRRFDAYLEENVEHCSEHSPLHLFIMDMDRFKQINDTYGHLEGDRALVLMADALRIACSDLNAFTARLGGDEFAVVCTHPIEGGPGQAAAAIKQSLSSVAEQAQVPYRLSCSIGYAACTAPEMPLSALLEEADRMLYAEKCKLAG